MTATNEIAWVFDPSPPSGGRTGGNVAEYAFRPDIETFVREVIQNVLDNKSADAETVHVLFRFLHLKGTFLQQFLEALGWSQLRPHIESAGVQMPGRRFKQALDAFSAAKSLLLLVVEDRNTTGLVGEEKGDASNFAALCRNTLYSSKPSETAGGSYGLGKAVLWLFSHFSAVLFNSVLETETGTDRSPRFIGRAELPWHQVGNTEFNGSGWLGLKVGSSSGAEWASSVWSPQSNAIAKNLYIDRDSATGTSILVVGFRNPADEDQEPKAMAQEMVTAVAKNFWPSIITGRLSVKVEVISDPAKKHIVFSDTVDEDDIDPDFASCWRAYWDQHADPDLRDPGDVIEVPIHLTIPARIDNSAPPIRAEASLVVRLAEENGTAEGVNQTVYFRGTGMIVKYEAFNRLSLTQRPFHAILVCGKARRSWSDSDIALDEFLRAAEPPEHKNWEPTPRLKEVYKPGYKKLLDDMERQIRDALRQLVSEKPPSGTDGPRMLMNLFPLGTKSKRPPPPPNPFKVRNLQAQLNKGAWEFSGRIIVRSDNTRRWKADIDLRFRAEDPTDSAGAVISRLTLDTDSVAKGARAAVKKGIGIITAPANVRQVDFSGATDPTLYPIDAKRTTVSLEVHPSLQEDRHSGK